MFEVALMGAGKIGEAMAALLTHTGEYRVRVCDANADRAQAVCRKAGKGATPHTIDVAKAETMEKALEGAQAVMSALPYYLNVSVAKVALKFGLHYFDLTEDVEASREVRKLAEGAQTIFMPQCGLAPGFISIAGKGLAAHFDALDTLKLRVGALPMTSSNRLRYSLTWSTEGLINEYINPCEVVRNGVRCTVPALEGLERITIAGVEYEAFNTSGGIGSLIDALGDKVRNLDYKTLRYPGHQELICFLLQDLRFADDRDTLRRVFERSLPATTEDRCVVYVEARGTEQGQFRQRSFRCVVPHAEVAPGLHLTAIQRTTASGILVPLDLVLTKKLRTKSGFARIEDIALKDFLENRFGEPYREQD